MISNGHYYGLMTRMAQIKTNSSSISIFDVWHCDHEYFSRSLGADATGSVFQLALLPPHRGIFFANTATAATALMFRTAAARLLGAFAFAFG